MHYVIVRGLIGEVRWACWSVLPSVIIIDLMFSSFKKGLRSIDFYQAVPSEYSEGTVSGACISVVSVALLVFLCIMSVINFSEPKIDSDLIIDQKHLAEKLKVHIDIEFPRYPCSFLSLDVENILKVHLVNVMDNLKKTVVPDGHIYDDSRLNDDQKVEQVIRDINEKKGCRMTGFFEIDRVPGNFHFSCHGYGSIIHRLVNQGYRMLDMTHHIYYLRFGEEESTEYGSNSLKDFNSEKEIEEVFMGITYTYFLDIIEKNTIDVNNEKGKESYIYTARLNEVILAQLPMVYFKYETNPMTVLHIYSHNEWHSLFIDIVGILGGIFTVASIIDHLVHSSIHFLVEKHRLNKLM